MSLDWLDEARGMRHSGPSHLGNRIHAPIDAPKRQVCRECGEGKCGACVGTALVDDGNDVIEVDCICASQDHETGDAS